MENVTEHNSLDASCEPASLAGVELTVTNTPKAAKLTKGENIIMEEILDPNHDRWGEFVNEMFVRHNKVLEKRVKLCDHTPKAIKAILRKMGGINVNETLKVFETDGDCYCSVLVSVVGRHIPFPEIMSYNHARWEEFVDELLRRFRKCDHTYRTTRAILQKMQGINVNNTLAVFAMLGGYCDCEVLLNVVGRYSPEMFDARIRRIYRSARNAIKEVSA